MNKASAITSKTTTKTTKKARTPRVENVEVLIETPKVHVEPEVFSFRQRLDVLITYSQNHMSSLKSHIQEMKKLQKEHDALIKEASKKSKKKKAQRDFTKPRRETGFAQPFVVSDELYSFLVKTKATMKDPAFKPTNQEEHDAWPRILVVKGNPVALTDATSHISKYIKEHNLQNPAARREIVPDAVLGKVFSEPVETSKIDQTKKVYTFLQLQRYIGHHFPKKEVKV